MIKIIDNVTINISFVEEKVILPKEIETNIDTFWQQQKLENPKLWNGALLCGDDFYMYNDLITLTCKRTSYSHHLYDERIGLPDKYACRNLVVGCLLETSDNFYVVGEMSEFSSFPCGLQIIGGNVDDNDINNGKINIFNAIQRECREEVNIDLFDTTQVDSFKFRYIILPEHSHAYFFVAKTKLAMNMEKFKEHFQSYLDYLRKNNLEMEFRKIHFIPKKEAITILCQMENPKRTYLTELLETDNK